VTQEKAFRDTVLPVIQSIDNAH